MGINLLYFLGAGLYFVHIWRRDKRLKTEQTSRQRKTSSEICMERLPSRASLSHTEWDAMLAHGGRPGSSSRGSRDSKETKRSVSVSFQGHRRPKFSLVDADIEIL